MSKVKDRLIEDINMRFNTDAKGIVDYLFDTGTLDDTSARKHVLLLEYVNNLVNSDLSDRQIFSNLGDDYGASRTLMQRLVSDPKALEAVALK